MTVDKNFSKEWYSTWGILVVLMCFCLDQFTKWLIDHMLGIGQGISIIPGFFEIIHVRNTGAAFGILQGMPESIRTPFFFAITILACGMILFMMKEMAADSILTKMAFYLILAGALGNLTDRIRLNEVVDFFNFHIGRFHWPAFNLADTYISIGIVYLLLYTIISGKKDGGRIKD